MARTQSTTLAAVECYNYSKNKIKWQVCRTIFCTIFFKDVSEKYSGRRKNMKAARSEKLRLAWLEHATYGFEVRCSIQLSYKRVLRILQPHRAFFRRAHVLYPVYYCAEKRVPGGDWTHDNQIHNLALYHWTTGTVNAFAMPENYSKFFTGTSRACCKAAYLFI